MSTHGYSDLSPHARGRTAGGTRKRVLEVDSAGLFRWTGVPGVLGIAWDRTHGPCPCFAGGTTCCQTELTVVSTRCLKFLGGSYIPGLWVSRCSRPTSFWVSPSL